MPQDGFADLVTSDRTRFRSNMPVSELTEHVTRAIESSDVSSTPPVVETMDGVMITKTSRPSTGPHYARGLEESWTRKETECVVAE